MNRFAQMLTLICWLGSAHAQGQECYRLLDSMDRMINRGDFSFGNLLKLADTVCLHEVGKKDSLYGDLLNAHAVFHLTKGNALRALPLLRRAMVITLNTRGFFSQHTGSLYSNMGGAYVLIGKPSEALAVCDTALLIKKQIRDTSASLGVTLLMRANALIALGQYEEAKQDLLESIQNAKNNHVRTDDYQYLTRVGSLGVAHIYLGEWQEAVPILEETVQIALKVFGEENGITVAFIGNLAQAYLALKNYPLAETHGEKALRLAEKVMPNEPTTNLMRQNLSVVYSDQGMNHRALALLLNVKSADDTRPSLDPMTRAVMWSNIGNVYLNLNDYAVALPYFTEAREQISKITGRESPRYALINGNLATCHHYLGNSDMAVQLAKESFEIIESLGESFPDYERYLANTLIPLKESDSVLQDMHRVVEIVRKKFGDQSPTYGYYLLNYAASMGNIGRAKEALPLMKRAEKILHWQSKRADTNYLLDALRNLGTCYEQLGLKNRALAYYQKALRLSRNITGGQTSFHAFLLVAAADMLAQQGKNRGAYSNYVAADTLYHRLSARNFAVLSDAGREAFLADVRPQLDRWHSFAWQHHRDYPEIPGLLYQDALSEKGQLLHSARSVMASLREDSLLSGQMNDWLALRQMIDYERGLLAQESADARFSPLYLDSLSRAADLAESILVQRSDAFAAASKPVGWRDVQARLAPDEAAVEFFHFNYAKPESLTDSVLYGALVLRPGDARPRFVPLFEEKQLARLLETDGIAHDEWLNFLYPGYSEESTDLYRLLFQPLEPHITGVRRLWFSPSGLLHKIAFPAIQNGRGVLLVERYDLQQVGSTRELASAVPIPDRKPKSARIFACVSYETDTLKMRERTRECQGNTETVAMKGSGTGKPEPLPNSLPEADTVALLLQESGATVDIRIGYEALEEDVKKQLSEIRSPDVLMFTTHGFAWDSLPEAFKGRFPKHNPMYSSGLLLAGSDQVWTQGTTAPGFQDGILTAREIGDLNLQGTRLAILSACESGLGEVKSSEGVYGLQRAFKIAGARQVLVTLWKIPDNNETQEFVGQFCRRWLESGDARAALRDTQLDFSKAGKSVQVWGAWVLI